MKHKVKSRANSSMPLRSVETVERVETDDGEYLKATGVLAKEGVYKYPRANRRPHRELLPGDSLEESEEAWERTPLALDHPITEDGIATVFGDGVEDPPVVGEVRSPAAEDDSETKLKGESWFDLSHSGEHDGQFDAIVDALENDETVETSAAYRANRANESGVYNGEQYDAVQRPLLPDHVAVFAPESGKTGNCSVEAGCGIGRANQQHETFLDGLEEYGDDYVEASDVDDDTAASIGRRVVEAIGLDRLFDRANGDGDGEQQSDERPDSRAGNSDSDTMKDKEKIDYLVSEHDLDEENIAPLEGEDCLDAIYTKFETEKQSADSGGDEGGADGGDPAPGTAGGDAPDGMEAVANQLTELSEELSEVKSQLNAQTEEKRQLAAEQIAEQTGVAADDIEISADAADDVIEGAAAGRANMAGVGGYTPSTSSDNSDEYTSGRSSGDRFARGDD